MFENMRQVKCELFSQKENRICKARSKSFDKVAPSDIRNGTNTKTPISHKHESCNKYEININFATNMKQI